MRERERERARDDEEEVGKMEVKRAVRKMKNNKTVGVDGIPMEIWKYGEKDTGMAMEDM